ncbi:hypothetical protein LOD99_6188 [Oopsacas minuta]|uniref:Mos1 transposase HTH domain-containing protein n=1 Tax=Oopsacas minuta TaxID=111878 RepID=A0AAV7JMU1_9METZ|nr:hypothetical protein LOD99_6188 [Oopsacas minuta]
MDIHEKMLKVYSDNALSYSCVEEWAKRFMDSRENLEDAAESGSPISIIRPYTIDMVKNIVDDDPNSTIPEIALYLDISTGSVDDILINYLEYINISSRWTLHILTENQKTGHLSCAKELWKLYDHADCRRLVEVCTGDETWIKHAEPMRKNRAKRGSLKVYPKR